MFEGGLRSLRQRPGRRDQHGGAGEGGWQFHLIKSFNYNCEKQFSNILLLSTALSVDTVILYIILQTLHSPGFNVGLLSLECIRYSINKEEEQRQTII